MAEQEKVLFALHFETLYLQAHRNRLTPRFKERLRALGLDLDRPLLPAYPVETGRSALQVAAEELYPELPREEALQQMGRTFISAWQDTLVGKAAAAMLRVVGTRRTLSRLDRAFRTGDNFTQTRVEELAPNKVRVSFNEVLGAPSYYAGIMYAGGELTGARNSKVTIERSDAESTVMVVEWDA